MRNYEYKNCPIPGGGYVTGFCFHQNSEGILYIRTDIGGSYRYIYEDERWESLSENTDMFDLRFTYPTALCTGNDSDDSLFIISGENDAHLIDKKNALFSISKDGGKSFIHKDAPFFAHGNLNGRGTGSRLVMNPINPKGLYYASQKDGLWKTDDEGESWEKLPLNEDYTTFVFVFPQGNVIVVGTAGLSNKIDDSYRGPSLYISFDEGKSFLPMPSPDSEFIAASRMSGYVAHRYSFDDEYLYITMNYTGRYNYEVPLGYSCDSGDLMNGKLLRYSIGDDIDSISYTNITPSIAAFKDKGIKNINDISFGLGGVSTCINKPGLLALSTLCRAEGDMIYISEDFGESWSVALFDLSIGNISFNTPYMRPECNGNESLIHWLSDIKINPFNPDEIWFNSGTGVFKGINFTKDCRSFFDCSKGIEETVHLNVYSLPEGPVKVIDIVGDLGGFAFKDIDKACDNSFCNENKDRYITCINADFSDKDPSTIYVTARGNWKGKTKGGLIRSSDYGQTFERIPNPYGISEELDERFRHIETPNVNAGWVAISSDKKNVVWSVADNINLYAKFCIVSNDNAKSFSKVIIKDLSQNDISDSSLHFKVFSDSVDPLVFYGFMDGLRLFISKDGGRLFEEISNRYVLPNSILGLIDCANKTEIRRNSGFSGEFYACFGEDGLLKLCFDKENMSVNIKKLTSDNDIVFRMGPGVKKDSLYYGGPKNIFLCGKIQNEYGFFITENEGESFIKLNDINHQFGDINSICGDARTSDIFYIASGSFGLKYGKEIN